MCCAIKLPVANVASAAESSEWESVRAVNQFDFFLRSDPFNPDQHTSGC
jgi:hypothetical protein